jgi:hypothetical protein
VEPGDLANLIASPDKLGLTAGDVASISFKGHDSFGNKVNVRPALTVDPPERGEITSDGKFRGLQAGVGAVVARSGEIETTILVTVSAGELSRLRILAPSGRVRAGHNYTFEAKGLDAGGNEVPVHVSWASTPAIGSIDKKSGKFSAVTPGEGVVMAYSGDIVAEIPVVVDPARP